jgi:thiol-disulfide isomerase/thioredoxin/uncharacterized membrane protein YphA (DoxX/SURF4 family)
MVKSHGAACFGKVVLSDRMNIILLAVRLLLAAVFAVAAVAKLTDRRGSEQAIAEMGLPRATAPLLARIVPVIELTIAATLLPASSAWWGGVAALGLLAAFTMTIAVNLWRGRAVDCHCFGQLTAGPIGRGTLLRNLLLVSLAALLVLSWKAAASLSAIAWFTELTTGERALVATSLVALALLVAVVTLLVRLLHQNERLIAALAEARVPFEADEPVVRQDMALPAAGLPIGAPSPEFQLLGLDGSSVTLADLLRANLPLALFFVSPNCGPCAALLPDIARWRKQYDGLLNFAFISSGGREENRQKFAGVGSVLFESGSEVSALFGARWTPAAVIVKADGNIGSRLANGSEAIRRLIIQTVTTDGSHRAARRAEMNGHGHANDSAAIGQPAPPVALPDLNGETVTLDDFTGARTLLIFWSPDCSFCEKMLDQLKRIEADPPPSAPRLLVIAKGSLEANRAAGLRSPVVLDSDFVVGRAFGASGTPSAVLIDERGNIASEVVSGESDILALAGIRKVTQPAR